MKRIVLLFFAVIVGLTAFPQQKHSGKIIPANKVNQVRKKPFRNAVKDVDGISGGSLQSPFKPKSILAEDNIGQTRYDLQTNQSVQNRVYAYPDGTVGAVWTRGMSDPGFADRGTGYNYNDGTTWGPAPTARIETSKAGWPSYQPYGPNGEIVVTHHNTAGLIISKRDNKGTGAWTESILAGPAGAVDISWPRMVTSGANHDKIHILASTYSAYQGLNLALLYYRSLDGGLTWDQQHVVLPGMSSANYKGFAGDCYAMAQPVGDNLAFVVGDNWVDLFLMKSTDGGSTWTKTVIFPHPCPMFDETTTLVLDTPTVCDGSVAVALDQNGKAHVSFGLMKVLNEDLTDGTTSYFPYTDGLVYWNEDMPQLASLDYETLEQSGNLIASTPDLNGNDTILEYVGLHTYYLSVTSMPTLACIYDGVVHGVYLAYTTVMEHMDNGTQNYRHIWSRRSYNNGLNWTDPHNENSSIVHNFDECVFPCLSPKDKGQYIPMSYQFDEEPGMAVRGDDPPDPYTDNTIAVIDYLKHIDGGFNDLEEQSFEVGQNYPNPSTGLTNIPLEIMKPVSLELNVVDNLGRTIQTKAIRNSGIGKKLITLDTKSWNAGVYFYIIKTDKHIITRKLTVQ